VLDYTVWDQELVLRLLQSENGIDYLGDPVRGMIVTAASSGSRSHEIWQVNSELSADQIWEAFNEDDTKTKEEIRESGILIYDSA
jgi:hypothetical protein